ncbi:MAG: hypothetical protein ACMZ7B_00600 [Balneola sp.]
MSLEGTITTLLTNGFHIHKVERVSFGNTIISAYKFDRLGAQVRYSLLFSDDSQANSSIATLITSSRLYKSTPVFINDNVQSELCHNFTTEAFFNLFGGIVNTGLILVSNLPEILDQLGHNSLPSGLSGEPDDLLEIYSSECLQFSMFSPTRHYGKDRLFQKLPDGLVLGNKLPILFDSKSYSKGFEFQADDIDRFASYIEDFDLRYSAYLGKIFSFLVISGHFNDSSKSISNRSDQLYKKSGCRLSCLTSKEMGEIVELLKNSPNKRNSIDWKNIFSELIISKKHIEKELARINQDQIH